MPSPTDPHSRLQYERTPFRAREPGFLLLAGLVGAHFLLLSRLLIYPDPILNYPFMGGDSHDWLANGLFLAGHDVRFSARPPLLPLAIAGLYGLSALHLLPVLLQLLVHLTALGLYRLLRRDYAAFLAWPIALAWLLNGVWQKLSLELMADVPAACLLAWSVFSWRRSGSRQPGYLLAGIFGGLSAVTQQVALLLPAAVLVTLLGFRRADLRSWRFLAGALLFLAPTGGWLIYKELAVGTVGDVLNRNWSLLRFHTDSLGTYAYAGLAFVGLPAAAAILLGVFSFARRARREPWCAFVLSLTAVILAFFVFFYDYDSLRFLAYVFPLSAVLAAEGLSRLRSRAATASAAMVVLLWALLPLPGPRADPTRIVLWPAPLTYLKAAATTAGTGSSRIDPFAVEFEVRPATTWIRHNVYGLAARLRRRPLEPRALSPETFKDDHWAVYFYDDPAYAGRRLGAIPKLGNLLLKRAQYLPYSAFGAAWQRLGLSRLGALDGVALYRARVPGLAGTWIVAVPAGSGADQELRGSPREPAAAGAEIAKAQQVAALIGSKPTVIFAPAQGLEPWQTYLPFLIATTRFFVIEPEREPGTRRMLGEGRGQVRVDDVVLVEHRLFGWSWIVLEKSP